jgi:hypothetical protein
LYASLLHVARSVWACVTFIAARHRLHSFLLEHANCRLACWQAFVIAEHTLVDNFSAFQQAGNAQADNAAYYAHAHAAAQQQA